VNGSFERGEEEEEKEERRTRITCWVKHPNLKAEWDVCPVYADCLSQGKKKGTTRGKSGTKSSSLRGGKKRRRATIPPQDNATLMEEKGGVRPST